MVGIADTGLYTVGYQIGAIIGLAGVAFNQAYVPWLFRKLNMNSGQDKIKIVKFTYLYFFVIVSTAVILGALAPFLMRVLVGAQFQGSSMYVIWIALGYAFDGMYYMVVNYIFYAEKTHLLAIVTFMGTIINIVFNYFFIRWSGAVGAAQATSLMYLLSFLFVWFLSSKVYPMPWRHALRRNTNPKSW
jgi:O-antigen/teichoic acid export membrane protein